MHAPNPSRHSLAAQQRKTETKMKIRPLHDRVVVKRLEEETRTAGGIIIRPNPSTGMTG
jgi:hypothetical protein